jgi:hypothetical protein
MMLVQGVVFGKGTEAEISLPKENNFLQYIMAFENMQPIQNNLRFTIKLSGQYILNRQMKLLTWISKSHGNSWQVTCGMKLIGGCLY